MSLSITVLLHRTPSIGKLSPVILSQLGVHRISTSSTSWIFKFFVPEALGFYLRCLLTKYEDHGRKQGCLRWLQCIRTGTRDSKNQDSEEVDVLRIPGQQFQKYLKCFSAWYRILQCILNKKLFFKFFIDFQRIFNGNEVPYSHDVLEYDLYR